MGVTIFDLSLISSRQHRCADNHAGFVAFFAVWRLCRTAGRLSALLSKSVMRLHWLFMLRKTTYKKVQQTPG